MKIFQALRLLLSVTAFAPALSLRGLQNNVNGAGILECKIYIAHALPDPDDVEAKPTADDEMITCMVNDLAYSLPKDVVDMYGEDLRSPEPKTMYIEGGSLPAQGKSVLSEFIDEIVVPAGAPVFFADNDTRRRKLQGEQRKTGTSSVLVMKVIANDASSTMSNDLLYDRIFSDGSNFDQSRGDQPAGTLTKTYQDCSFQQLNFIPATGYDIDRGIGFVDIDMSVDGKSNRQVENAVTTAINEKYGSVEDWDHIIYCIPPGTNRGWVAYGYVHFYRSIYNDEWCGQNSALVHEVGHNIGLQHSHENGNYRDQTDMIGFSYNWVGGPRMCFNAHKNFVLGWYDSRKIEIDPDSGPWVGALIAFADFGKTVKGENVLVHFKDIYIQYNRGKGANRQVMKYPNRLVAIQASSPTAASESLGGILVGGIIEYESYSIEFCSTGTAGDKDFIGISVYRTTDGSRCGGAPTNSVSTDPPSPAPTPNPSVQPKPTTANPMTAEPSSAPPTATATSPPSTASPTTPAPSTAPPTIVVYTAPSNSPSVLTTAPSTPPSPSPSKTPTYDDCDDSKFGTFLVPFLSGYETCLWLKARPNIAQGLCEVNNVSQARSVCPETCGACTDTCEDDDMYFSVAGTNRNCKWLELRPKLHAEECVVGKGAWNHCRDTCGNCNPFPTGAPSALSATPSFGGTGAPTSTASPTMENPYDSCDDDKDASVFVSTTNKKEPCRWFETRADERLIYCNPFHSGGAYDKCEETCGKCSDDCEDDNESSFLVDGVTRDCIFVTGRSHLHESLCVAGQDAWNFCRETCGSCLAPSLASLAPTPASPAPSSAPSSVPSSAPSSREAATATPDPEIDPNTGEPADTPSAGEEQDDPVEETPPSPSVLVGFNWSIFSSGDAATAAPDPEIDHNTGGQTDTSSVGEEDNDPIEEAPPSPFVLVGFNWSNFP